MCAPYALQKKADIWLAVRSACEHFLGMEPSCNPGVPHIGWFIKTLRLDLGRC